jgi:hypothetical protein
MVDADLALDHQVEGIAAFTIATDLFTYVSALFGGDQGDLGQAVSQNLRKEVDRLQKEDFLHG